MDNHFQKLWDCAQEIYQSIYDLYHQESAEIEELRQKLSLQKEEKIIFALKQRVVDLKEDPILQILKTKKHADEIAQCKHIMLTFVGNFYAKRFEKILSLIHEKHLLTPYYQELLFGVHQIGLGFNAWFMKWREMLLDGFNTKVTDETKERLLQSIDRARGELQGERSYSIAQFAQESIIYLSYAQAFPQEIGLICERIATLILKLKSIDPFDKEGYILYLEKLYIALGKKDREGLIESWREVDRAWLEIKGFLQIAHPFEYYEDIYRHSVAPEWDVRLKNPYSTPTHAKEEIKQMQEFYSKKLKISWNKNEILDKTIFFDGMPLFFYGSLNNGLFSAQVIPNDETMPYKKIFAYTQRILHSLRAKPKMRLDFEIFPSEFLQRYEEILQDQTKWEKIYDTSTNGHEYGHILWVDTQSESIMNAKGEYKNLEEFKATSSGLVAYFLNHQAGLEDLILEHIYRSVKLMAYSKVSEVIPYYCEGLLHLVGAFESQILSFDGVRLGVHWERVGDYVQWYLTIYEKLVLHYIAQQESGRFLFEYLQKDEIYLPRCKEAKSFVKTYIQRYQEIGQEILK